MGDSGSILGKGFLILLTKAKFKHKFLGRRAGEGLLKKFNKFFKKFFCDCAGQPLMGGLWSLAMALVETTVAFNRKAPKYFIKTI